MANRLLLQRKSGWKPRSTLQPQRKYLLFNDTPLTFNFFYKKYIHYRMSSKFSYTTGYIIRTKWTYTKHETQMFTRILLYTNARVSYGIRFFQSLSKTKLLQCIICKTHKQTHSFHTQSKIIFSKHSFYNTRSPESFSQHIRFTTHAVQNHFLNTFFSTHWPKPISNTILFWKHTLINKHKVRR